MFHSHVTSIQCDVEMESLSPLESCRTVTTAEDTLQDSKSKLKRLYSFHRASRDAHSCDPAPVLWGSPEAARRGTFPPWYRLTIANINCQSSKRVKQAFRWFQPLTWRWHQVEQRSVPTKTCSRCRSVSKVSVILGLSQYFRVVCYTPINNQHNRWGPLWHWTECS